MDANVTVHCYAGATLPAISKVLRTLKATEDATAEPATLNMHLLCDMALAVAPAIVERHSPGTLITGKFPGHVPLPKLFFRSMISSKIPSSLLCQAEL